MGITEGGITPGEPFILEKRLGKGRAVVVGAYPEGDAGENMIKAMLLHYAGLMGIQNALDASSGTIVIERYGEDHYDIIVNMDGKGGTVQLEMEYLDVLDQVLLPPGALDIGRYDYKVIRRARGKAECDEAASFE